MLEILGAIPAEWREKSRNLGYWAIIARLGLGLTHGIAEKFDVVSSFWLEGNDPLAPGRLLLCRGLLEYHAHDHDRARRLLTDAVDCLPPDATTERMYACTMLGQLELDAGRDDAAAVHLETAGELAMSLPLDEQWAWKAIGAERGNTYAFRGDLSSATTKYELLIDELPPPLMHLEGWLRCRLVTLWIERGDLERAAAELRRADRLRREFPGSWHHDLALARARLRIATGDIEAAERWITSYIRQVRRHPVKHQFVLLLSRIWLSRGELALVRHWLADMDTVRGDDVRVFGDISRDLIAIEANLAEGNFR